MNSTATTHPLAAAKVFIVSAYDDPDPITDFRRYAQLDKIKKHTVVEDPADADIILFIENSRYHHDYFFGQVKRHPLVKAYPHKAYMYNPHDLPWYVLPGLYASMPSYIINKSYVLPSPYLETINTFINCDFSKEPEFLFSFYGVLSSPVRKKVITLTHPRAKVLLSIDNMYEAVKPQDRQKNYANLLTDSKFVLCPRGTGTSSIRLFEVLKAGRVPVILSDFWVPPIGSDWREFAVFVPENDVEKIPEILEQRESEWPRMSRRAREVWENQFAPQTIFNYFIECILQLDKKRSHTLAIRYHSFSNFFYWYCRKQGGKYIKPHILPLYNFYKKVTKKKSFYEL